METLNLFLIGIQYLFFIYAATLIVSYIVLSVLSTYESIDYFKKNDFVNFKDLLASPFSPAISIIAPAYNEGLNIVDNVRSLLSIHYVNFDVIVVNDGSKDDSLAKLIEEYDLRKADYIFHPRLKTKTIKSVYKSNNPAFEKLIVVDKVNGGKADALNAGLNISRSECVLCVDVDCVLLEDSLQKMVKPFLDETDHKVIATGGVIRIANACTIRDGRLIDVRMPDKFIERAQILEYFRSFMLGRMAWARINGLLVISGAFGLFDKEIVMAAGGYDSNLVGEDMELVVRMRRYMREQNLKYKIAYIPDPLCWTEAPDNPRILISQRNRWARGTIETLRKHRKIGLNPKYKMLGMISYPYWYLYERLAPIIEISGLLFFIVLACLGQIFWTYALSFLFTVLLFSVIFSLVAILSEEMTYHQYKKKGDGWKLILTAFLDPILFHPVLLYAALKGNYDFFTLKEKSWGRMVRKGLTSN